ncbi:MAG TPA: hypothetical protein VES19_14970 [Candidatus Limnocylindrales bacterium]|nr:hypothetical protein [Candidatus Limnocylindrales bacterium]
MARAKRTERTEARRRHRAEQASLAELEPGAEGDAPASTAESRSDAKATPARRPGIVASFRGAMRPLDLLGDLKATPQVLASWGFLAALGITAAAAAWFVFAYNDAMATLVASLPAGTTPTTDQLEAVVGANTIPYFVGTMALQPPPAIGAFLIGFTAKRASWLGGLVYGIYVTVLAIVILQTPSGQLLAGVGSADAVLIGHAAWSPVGAAVFASAAAWYRRFLDLANPNRSQSRPSKTSKAPQGRGNVKPNVR